MNIVLVAPEIPPNTGNVARLCAATNTKLHLIEPLGFRLDDRELKRAGMDYWQQVEWTIHKSWKNFLEAVCVNTGDRERIKTTQPQNDGQNNLPRVSTPSLLYFFTGSGKRIYSDVRYQENDFLVFGRESVGLPEELLRENEASTVRIPLWNPNARSLNLSNAVAIVLYEALRQVRQL